MTRTAASALLCVGVGAIAAARPAVAADTHDASPIPVRVASGWPFVPAELPPSKCSSFGTSGPRKALVIGNAQYANLPKLNGAEVDADAMASRLLPMGFGGVVCRNLPLWMLENIAGHFVKTLAAGDTALFYYSGHAAEHDGTEENYLYGVDFGRSKKGKASQAYRLQSLLGQLEDRNEATNIVILDACRTAGKETEMNPLTAEVPGVGTYIAFGTSPGRPAFDGEKKDENSPFTKALLDELTHRGDLEIDALFRNVRRHLWEETKDTGREQRSWTSHELLAPFYFREPSPPMPPPGGTAATAGSTTP